MVGYNQPLGLPKGSVRAILAIGTTVGGILLVAKGIIQFEQYIALTSAVFAFYFGTKSQEVTLSKEEQEEICES